MSPRRHAPREHRAAAHARDLLEGRLVAGAGELLEAIHEVNPTGRELEPADERSRYELKARLQSLLIGKFPDDLVITADAPGVVAIRHRYLGRDACHARIDELDDAARARVRWMLDTTEPAGVAEDRIAARAETAAAADLLAHGRAALAAFDYDAARAHFEQAALGEDGDPVAALELLELLVDHLALDDQALALEPRLPALATSSRDVRALLALAAARLGDAAAAQRLLATLTGARAADAWTALADHALARRDAVELDQRVAQVAQADPAHPELVRLREQASRLRAELRGPGEQALVALAEAGDPAAVESAARALLARWPDSAVAGRILGRIVDQQRTAEAERLLARARAAVADGDLAHASELGRQARAVGADTAALLEAIREADAARRSARDEAEVASVCALLTGAELRSGLAAFVALEPELRRRVEARSALPMLAWIDQIAPRPRLARHGAIVDAVLAIAAAGEALDRDDADAVLAILAPHESSLAGVARAGELRVVAVQRIAARRRRDAVAALAGARRALAAGELERCARLCAQADRRDLDAADGEAREQIWHELQRQRDAARRHDRIDALVASGDLVSARRELARVRALGTQPEATEARLAALGAELRRVWRMSAEDVAARKAPVDPLGEMLGRLPYTENVAPWLVTGGRELVAAGAYAGHVFMARVSVADGRLLDRRSLSPPEPLGHLVSTAVDGDTLWLFGETGRVLQVSWRTGEPIRWSSIAPLLEATERIEQVFKLPGGAHLWCASNIPGGIATERVIEIEELRVRRELPRSRHLHPVVAGASSCVLGAAYDGGTVRYDERGALMGELAALARVQLAAATVDAASELVVVVSPLDEDEDEDYDDDEGDGDGGVEILRLRAGRVIHRQSLPEAWPDRPNHCAAARAAGLLVVHHNTDLDVARLVVWRFTESGLALLYAVEAPSHLPLAQDADAAEVVGLWDSARRIEIVRLGEQPPVFDGGLHARARWDLPQLGDYLSCAPHQAQDPDSERLIQAGEVGARGDWAAARALLEVVPVDRVTARWSDHHRHLLGIAWLRTGVAATHVHALWDIASTAVPEDRLFSCRLELCLGLVDAMPAPLSEAWWDDEAPVLHQLRGAIATADTCLAAGDADGALRAVRRRVVTRSRELQSWARLAAAWLALDAAEDRFGKAIALAQLVALHADGALDLPLVGAWSKDRLARLVEDAERWLRTWQESPPASRPAPLDHPEPDAQGSQHGVFQRYTVGVNAAVATPPPPRSRLERFRAIRARLDPSGDPGALLDAYVDSPQQAVSQRVAAELELAPASTHLIVGGIGSGKTTELLMTERRLLKLEDVMTVYVDVSKQHDIAKMVPGTLLAQITLAIADQVATVDPTNPLVRAAREVAHGAWRGLDEDDRYGDDSHLTEFVPGVLHPPHPMAEDVVRARVPLEGLLVLTRQRARHLVVLLDGLDRMSDLATLEQLVVQDVKVLSALGIGVVLVGPLRALYGLDRLLVQQFDSFHYQPWIDVTGNPDGRAFLVDVLTRRAEDALDPPGIEALVDASGGVLRDLLALAQSALVEVYMSGHDRIGSHDVDDAVDAFGRKHLQGLRPAEIEALQRVRTQGTFVQASEDDLALLMTRRVLAYRSEDRPRYAVHPTIAHLLAQLAAA